MAQSLQSPGIETPTAAGCGRSTLQVLSPAFSAAKREGTGDGTQHLPSDKLASDHPTIGRYFLPATKARELSYAQGGSHARDLERELKSRHVTFE